MFIIIGVFLYLNKKFYVFTRNPRVPILSFYQESEALERSNMSDAYLLPKPGSGLQLKSPEIRLHFPTEYLCQIFASFQGLPDEENYLYYELEQAYNLLCYVLKSSDICCIGVLI